jgi:ubiquinone/menaquinone biosynthesis C-methylase UbiE
MLRKVNTQNQHDRFVCTTEEYNTLYSRYLRHPGKLLEMVGYKTSETLLDLCGGTGAASLAALEMGANVNHITLLDLNPRCSITGIKQISTEAIDGLQQLASEGKQFDVIVCRQAFAYLEVDGENGENLANLLAKIMRPGARFIFNSFIRPRWLAKTYSFNGSRYIELAGYFRRRVFRLQVQLGKGHDLTVSKWHREERIFEIFNAHFQIKTNWSKNAVYWIFTRRDTSTKETLS